jgi:Domain of unknown function (DUF4340)
MQLRWLILLAAATAVCAALAIGAVVKGDRYATSSPANERAFPALAGELGQVASVKFERKDLTVTFLRRGSEWLVAQKDDYPADAGKVGQIVLTLADMRLIEPKTRLPSLYPRLQVEDPGQGGAILVSLADGSGKSLAGLIVGKRRFDRLGEGQDGVYVRRPGRAQSWLASGDLDLSGGITSWLDRRILDIPDGRIAKLRLIQPDGTQLLLSRAKSGDQFVVEKAPANTKYKSDTATNEPAMALASLDFEDVAPAAKMPVPASGEVSASYTTFDGLTIELRLIDKDNTAWVAVAATGSGKAAAEVKKIEARVSGWSYAIPSYKAAMVKTRFSDLVAPPKGS